MATETMVNGPVVEMGRSLIIDIANDGRGYVVVMTKCCNASTTYVEDSHVCKGCYEEVDTTYGWGFFLDEAHTDNNISFVAMFTNDDVAEAKTFVAECEKAWAGR
jgi:hypothetical protein